MAHAALISLRLTIKRLINSSHVMISPPSRNILDDLHAKAKLLQELIEEICKKWVLDEDGRGKMKDFQRELREASCILEDALETHFLDLIVPSQSDDNRPSPIPFDMMALNLATITFTETLKKYTPPDDYGVAMVGVEEEEEEEEEEDDDDQEEEEKDDDDDDQEEEKEEDEDDGDVMRRLRVKYGLVGVKEEEDDDDDDQEEEKEDDDDDGDVMRRLRVKYGLVGVKEEENGDDNDQEEEKEDDDDDGDVMLRLRVKYGLVGVKEEEDDDDDEEEEENEDDDDITSKIVRKGEEARDDDDDVTLRNVASSVDFGRNKSKTVGFEEEGEDRDVCGKRSNIVGFSDIIGKLRDLLLLPHWEKSSIQMVSLVGMAGIGKTALAKEIYEDPLISKSFPHRVWVTVGQKYRVLDVIQQILIQLSPETKNDGMDYFTLCANINKSFGRAGGYLIVLDDVWDRHLSSEFLDPFLHHSNNHRILILFTTRQQHVGVMAGDSMLKLRLMDEEESWDLLREKVFSEKSMSCPPQLVKAGKKIAENCDGLPLTIVTVADLLSKADNMTTEYWKMVAEKENPVLKEAYDQISEVLYRSFDKLPEFLKALYLYLAIFPPNSEITVTKLSMLWDAEGFDEKNPITALDTLEDFVLFSLVLERRSTYNNKLKACVLHSVFWHLCVREARENKLFHVLKKFSDSSAEGIIRNQRRLCIHNNVLFGIKDANKSMASSASTARSLLCTGTHHRYPVPICFGDFRLLRVIDALTIRLYEFPVEVVKLVQLRYLALLYDGKLPPIVSKLWNLQFLIVCRYLSILKPHEDESYLPVEIWGMKELKHLQVMGSNLPDPCDGACLPNLVTLLGVSSRSCTKCVLEGLPKLEKLGVRIELPVDDVVQPFSCFDHISHLNELSSLKCVVVNPKLGFKVIRPPASSSLFPEGLRRLSLSGCGYSWEDMRIIASLQKLKVLKLRGYAFRGQIWEIKQEDFPRLEFLKIEDTDLVQWIVGSGSLRRLECLILKNCYKLEDIQGKLGEYLESVEIDDCNLLAVNYAKQLQNDNSALKLSIHLSCYDVKVKHSQLLD